ncbi:MAG TPA: hypothetical protein PLL69_03945 [Gemmatimonadales bacterium]|nr:hypothetical protein [Gemmatimonadales bacterium]
MRCLGRLVALVILVLLLAAGWLYRTEITRYVRGIIDPMSVARRTGVPSPEALERAESKVRVMVAESPDSVVLAADELASLVVRGTELLGVRGIDSVSVELGDRRIRVRSVVDLQQLPSRLRAAIPGDDTSREEVIAEGELAPLRAGIAEWRLDRVIVRGLPLPAELVGRILNQVTGAGTDGRVQVAMPPQVSGFRVRPEGVAVYRGSGQ